MKYKKKRGFSEREKKERKRKSVNGSTLGCSCDTPRKQKKRVLNKGEWGEGQGGGFET